MTLPQKKGNAGNRTDAVVDLHADFAVFDRLPRCIRDVLNYSFGIYAAEAGLNALRDNPRATEQQVADAIKRHDKANLERILKDEREENDQCAKPHSG